MNQNLKLFEEAMKAWSDLASFRAERERNKRYTYGRQWEDPIFVDGRWTTEADYIRSQGSVPLKNNMIRRLVRNVLGVWRNEFVLPLPRPVCPEQARSASLMATLLKANAQANRLEELYARTMEEFLISGMAIHRKSFGLLGRKLDCRTDYVNPSNFFFVTEGCDFRCQDFSLTGEIHDISFRSLVARFADSEKSLRDLQAIYGASADDGSQLCRVVEVWRQEAVAVRHWHDISRGEIVTVPAASPLTPPQGCSQKWEIRRMWVYYFLTPTGHVLLSGLSPYAHGSHPYVVKVYPFIDGEIHSFVADIIDQQRYTNRLITLYDWVMRASAKGVLLFPEGALPEGADINDIAEEWSRFNGVIIFKPKAGMPLPQQVSSNATNIGIGELLRIQLQMFEDISGVNPALQGRLESSSVSGTLFNQQTRNALTSLCDLLASFREFVRDATIMDASNIARFYSDFEAETVDFEFAVDSNSALSAAASASSQSVGVSRSTERDDSIR